MAEEFPHASPEPLRAQTDLTDETGDDKRQYTGEPVETAYGTVTPQQMAAGADEVVGGGEFPNSPARGDHRDGAAPDDDTPADDTAANHG